MEKIEKRRGRPSLSRSGIDAVQITLKLSPELLASIQAVLGEDRRADFIRVAIEREIARRRIGG